MKNGKTISAKEKKQSAGNSFLPACVGEEKMIEAVDTLLFVLITASLSAAAAYYRIRYLKFIKETPT